MRVYLLSFAVSTILFLLLPVFLNVSLFLDLKNKKCYFALYFWRVFKIYGGYASLYDEGIAFHLTKSKALLLSYKEIIQARNDFAITKGFCLYACSHTFEIGGSQTEAAIYLAALAQILSGGIASFVFARRKSASFKGDTVLYQNKSCFKITLRIILVFNFIILLIAFCKILLQKLSENNKKYEYKSRQKG